MKVAGFQWDSGNWPKCGKHGVSREEIEFVFTSGADIAPDPRHSWEEDRLIAVGRNTDGRPIFVGFTLLQEDACRTARATSIRRRHFGG